MAASNHKKRGWLFYIQSILLLPFLYTLAILPFPILYIISDGFYFILYKVFKYRVKVVRMNLKNSFPQKSANELYRIEKEFYKFLCDMMLETIALLAISEKSLRKHCYVDPTKNIYKTYFDQKQSVVAVLGHFANWEMVCQSSALFAPHRIMVIYKPITNAFFESLFIRLRTRRGAYTIKMSETLRQIVAHRHEVIMPVMVGDQSPSEMNGAIWMDFLNQDTPVMNGIEKIVKKMNYPLVVNEIKRHQRGVYEIIPITLIENPAACEEGEITRLHTQWLEKMIQENPVLWLWSHRRWKHQRN